WSLVLLSRFCHATMSTRPSGSIIASASCALTDRCLESRRTSTVFYRTAKGRLHLTAAVEGWLVPGRNPFGLYFYMEDVEAWATVFRDEILGKSGPEVKPWGMYEFAMSDPDETLVRVGWPSRLRKSPPTAT